MKNVSRKRLALTTEKIRRLSNPRLADARGGGLVKIDNSGQLACVGNSYTDDCPTNGCGGGGGGGGSSDVQNTN